MTIDVRNDGQAQFDNALVAMAERELSAFAAAVTQMFGVTQQQQAIEDWLQELTSTDWPAGKDPDWRQISIAAATRLSNRVCLLR